jgi:uncharacterized protein involved in exopolysaccharide biosynthesis
VDSYSGYTSRGEMDLIAFVAMIWRHRLVVGLMCAVALLAAIAYLKIATPMYRAEVVLVPPEEDSMSGASAGGLGDKLGGLASLAGLNLGQETPSQLSADAMLDSRALAEEFVQRNDLVPVLLKKSKRKTLWLAVRSFKENLSKIRKDQVKGTTKVTVEWTDPDTAARWANGLVALANELSRTRARTEASRNIEYLNKQIALTTDVDVRRDLYEILETQMRALMLANGRVEYAFHVVDPAVPPEVRSRPQVILVLLIGLAVGLAVGCTVAFIRERISERRRQTAESASWHQRRLADEATAAVATKA